MKKVTIGIIGGGQLGGLLIQNSQKFSNSIEKFVVLDPNHDCPASALGGFAVVVEIIVGSLQNSKMICELCEKSDIVTFEIEHLNIEQLLSQSVDLNARVSIIPNPNVLQIIQDKGKQKQFFTKHSIPTAPYQIGNYIDFRDSLIASTVSSKEKINLNDEIFTNNAKKIVVKSCTDGYDGKGVSIIPVGDLLHNVAANPNEFVFEKYIDCEKELSVLVAKDCHGNFAIYDPVEMIFHKKSNMLDYLITPANITEKVKETAKSIAKQLVEAFESPGLFAVEMFLDKRGTVLVNEVAPRPHNSGHQTIEANETSQYEQLLKILLSEKVGSPAQKVECCALFNLIGTFNGKYRVDEKVKRDPDIHIYDYHKSVSRINRKLGHVTITGTNRNELIEKMKATRKLISLIKV